MNNEQNPKIEDPSPEKIRDILQQLLNLLAKSIARQICEANEAQANLPQQSK